MSERRGPELIIFELGRLASFGESRLCAEEIICVLDEANELGVRHLVLEVSGPLSTDDLVRLASSASKRAPHVTVVLDRASPLDPAIAAELGDAGVCDVAVPFDSLGNLECAPHTAIEALRDEGIGVRAIVPGWPGLSDLADLASRLVSIGVTRLQVNVTCSLTRCPIMASMVERLAYELVAVARSGTLAVIATELPLVRRIAIDSGRDASVGSKLFPAAPMELADSRTTMRIGKTGEVMPSRALPLVAGNVRRQRLDGIWRVSKVFAGLRDRERLVGRCGECAWREVCGGSRARAWHAEGDYLASDPACGLPLKHVAGATRRATA